jgi:hypothetical protein
MFIGTDKAIASFTQQKSAPLAEDAFFIKLDS